MGGCSCDILGVWDWACSVGCIVDREWVKVAVGFRNTRRRMSWSKPVVKCWSWGTRKMKGDSRTRRPRSYKYVTACRRRVETCSAGRRSEAPHDLRREDGRRLAPRAVRAWVVRATSRAATFAGCLTTSPIYYSLRLPSVDAGDLLKRLPRTSGESSRFTQVLLASETTR